MPNKYQGKRKLVGVSGITSAVSTVGNDLATAGTELQGFVQLWCLGLFESRPTKPPAQIPTRPRSRVRNLAQLDDIGQHAVDFVVA